jgi:hypothetical protein
VTKVNLAKRLQNGYLEGLTTLLRSVLDTLYPFLCSACQGQISFLAVIREEIIDYVQTSRAYLAHTSIPSNNDYKSSAAKSFIVILAVVPDKNWED